jgi:hypothetical protein
MKESMTRTGYWKEGSWAKEVEWETPGITPTPFAPFGFKSYSLWVWFRFLESVSQSVDAPSLSVLLQRGKGGKVGGGWMGLDGVNLPERNTWTGWLTKATQHAALQRQKQSRLR